MAFFNTGTGKSFDSQPDGNVISFEETWVIYQELHFVFEEIDAGFVLTEFEPGDVLLSGYDCGVVSPVALVVKTHGWRRSATGRGNRAAIRQATRRRSGL